MEHENREEKVRIKKKMRRKKSRRHSEINKRGTEQKWKEKKLRVFLFRLQSERVTSLLEKKKNAIRIQLLVVVINLYSFFGTMYVM